MWVKLIQMLIALNEQVIFYPKLRRFYKSHFSKKRPVIFDVGSNEGQSIDFFSGIYTDAVIYAFEPNVSLYNHLKNKYSKNPDIHIYNLGLSNVDDFLEFSECVMHETSTFENLNFDSGYLKRKAKILGFNPHEIIKSKYSVRVTKLSEFIHKQQINRIDVLKIDTEGHELKCLQGLFDNLSPDFSLGYIQFESHNDDMYLGNEDKGAIFDLLAKFGYVNKVQIKHGFGNIDEYICYKD